MGSAADSGSDEKVSENTDNTPAAEELSAAADPAADDGDDLFASSDVPVKKEKVAALPDFTGESLAPSSKSKEAEEVSMAGSHSLDLSDALCCNC